ncbi:MAG: FAD-dependent oxidoreductase [Eubacteriales bacterium]|nr:FAD-dependent oxidoreductase [Eubacteriales bacterium]
MPNEISFKLNDGTTFKRNRNAVAKIDSEMCVNCGVCRRSCPTSAIEEYQRDICRLCPDCTSKPKMFPEESKRFATKHACSLQCPLGTIPEGYINMVAEGKFSEAYDLISELNPLPTICSMICSHPCEDDCKRGLLIDEPIAIRAIKRFVLENVEPLPLHFEQKYDKKVAVIGGGPAGLTAAADLARKGYRVKIFEAGSELGGMAKRAIPDFRIDKEKLAKDTKRLIDAGIEVEYGCVIGRNPSIQDLMKEQYAAVIVAVGAPSGFVLPIPGSNAEKVYDALSFMRRINAKQPVSLGKKAVVIGGGSVALDTARTLKRLGVEVVCACLESGDEVPAPKWEIAEAAEEGVSLIEGVAPVRVVAELFTAKGVEFKRVERIDKDENGRIQPVTVEESEYIIDCDMVIFATGQKTDLRALAEGGNLETDLAGRFVYDADTLATSNPNVFVAGDAMMARGSVITAMASGRKAALSVDNLIQDRQLTDRAEKQVPNLAPVSEKIFPAVRLEKINPQPVPKARFRDTFEQVEGVYDADTVMREARRCMKCGYSSVNPDNCLGCGMCEKLCPANAISLVKG